MLRIVKLIRTKRIILSISGKLARYFYPGQAPSYEMFVPGKINSDLSKPILRYSGMS
ncbi:unnamed protein product [Arabidopsis halleri]